MATTVGVVAANVLGAIASTPTGIARAMASIVGIVVIGVAVVAAVATVASGRRRRIPATAWAALAGERGIQVAFSSIVSLALQKLCRGLIQVLVFAISCEQSSKLLAQ